MKKNLNKKLLLNKNTVVSLESNEMNNLKGGYISFTGTCASECEVCTLPYCDPYNTRTC